MEEVLIPIGEAAERLQVTVTTLRRWDEAGKLRAYRKTPGGDRYYRESDLYFFPNTLYETAFNWASISPEYSKPAPKYLHTENRASFEGRLMDFQKELMAIPEFEEIFPLVIAVCGEIGGNSFDHNIGKWPDLHGIFFSYDIENREVVLADRGVGIKNTLRQTVPTIQNDKEALRIAFTDFISGRAGESRGNGLKFVREVVEKNLMHLKFQTGDAQLEIKRESQDLDIEKAVRYLSGCIAYIKY